MGASTNSMNQIRVLHVLPSMSMRGGMLSVVMNYHHAIDRDAVAFDYLYLREPDDRVEEARSLGARVWHVPFAPKPGGFQDTHAFFREHSGEFDIVHCHPIFAPQVVGNAAKRAGAKCVIAHSHATKFSDKPAAARRNRAVSRFVGLFATDYMACSDAARVLLGRHGKDAYIMHNAIDCDRFAFDPVAREEVRGEFGIHEGTFLLGTLGRLEPQKNQLFLPSVMATLRERGADCRLVIAGTGSLRDAILSKVEDLGVSDRIMLIGDRSDAPRLYSAFDAFLLPSLFEGLPVSAVEAQVSGLPCLLADTVTSEVAFGPCRFLPNNDACAWAESVCQLNAVTDRSRGPELARAAGFDIRVEAQRLAQHYCEILGR